MPFGYDIDADYDLGKDQRRSRLGWVLVGGFVLSVIVSLVWGMRFATEVFQILIATILFYGANFYVDRSRSLRKRWGWQTMIATTPLHIAYLAALLWSDKALPNVMTKAIVFMPILTIAFALESICVDGIVNYFRRSCAEQSEDLR